MFKYLITHLISTVDILSVFGIMFYHSYTLFTLVSEI